MHKPRDNNPMGMTVRPPFKNENSTERAADTFTKMLERFQPVIEAKLHEVTRDMSVQCAGVAASLLADGVVRDDLAEQIRKIRITYRGILSVADDAILLEAVFFLGAKQ